MELFPADTNKQQKEQTEELSYADKLRYGSSAVKKESEAHASREEEERRESQERAKRMADLARGAIQGSGNYLDRVSYASEPEEVTPLTHNHISTKFDEERRNEADQKARDLRSETQQQHDIESMTN